jgi:lipoate-protein ligase A
MAVKSGLRVFRSSSHDIFLNLAIEDRLFRTFEPNERILFLWSNAAAVVIGRYQNPWLECRVAEIERDGVALARRQSGGGAVWHDRGNLCFTFMSSSADMDRAENIDLVVRALCGLGLASEANERLDVLVAGRKVSGSAFRESSGRSFHHGTLLVRADLDALERYLASGGAAHRAKGVKSVRSPVVNLAEGAPHLSVEMVEAVLASEAFARWGSATGAEEIEELDIESLASDAEVASYRTRLASREWRFGSSPPFARRVEAGEASLTLEIEGGAVREALLEAADGRLPGAAAEAVAEGLPGLAYEEKNIAAVLRSLGTQAAAHSEGSTAETLTALAVAIEEGRFS